MAALTQKWLACIDAVVDLAPSFDECPGVAARLSAIIAGIPEPLEHVA